MPISFLDQQQQPQQQQQAQSPPKQSNRQVLDSRLKARQFVREFASHRFGVFKESGFRSDFMYPAFSSVAGLSQQLEASNAGGWQRWARWMANGTQLEQAGANRSELQQEDHSGGSGTLRGFDEHFRECKFETSPASGLPANAQAANCLPYLVRADKSLSSFNLMSSDPFSYATAAAAASETGAAPAEPPVQWDELFAQTRWHFCGENFASNPSGQPAPLSAGQQADAYQPSSPLANNRLVQHEHNQRAANKQNKMCQEKSVLEVIRMSDDFRDHQQFR